MKENIIQVKSFDLAVRIVELGKELQKRNEFILSKQIIRSGTSAGANIEEAIGGISKRDFRAKMSISYKEARETMYWLRILAATDYIDKVTFESLKADCDEVLRILFKIIENSKS